LKAYGRIRGKGLKFVETIIVGGGPAGSACGWHLARNARDVLILDKSSFPRLKLCAGWITEKVLNDLEFSRKTYPHSMLKLNMRTHIALLPFSLPGLPTIGDNYSIRRTEFDDWLLKRSNAPVEQYNVKTIRRDGDLFIIGNEFSCRYLVGAGGTMCPVRRSFFPDSRIKSRQLATLEKEFEYPVKNNICHLFFFYRRLHGYAWFVPKSNGYVNIGIGGEASYFKSSDATIHDHFRLFLGDLRKHKLLDKASAQNIRASGHPYYLFSYKGKIKHANCFLVGDSAGLATVDMGEGIGPGIESGLLAAREIMGTGEYSRDAISKYSFGGITQSIMKRTLGRPHAMRPE